MTDFIFFIKRCFFYFKKLARIGLLFVALPFAIFLLILLYFTQEHVVPAEGSANIRFQESYKLALYEAKEWQADAELVRACLVMEEDKCLEKVFIFTSDDLISASKNEYIMPTREIFVGCKHVDVYDKREENYYLTKDDMEKEKLLPGLDVTKINTKKAIENLKNEPMQNSQDYQTICWDRYQPEPDYN
jgi:hypothetical protein